MAHNHPDWLLGQDSLLNLGEVEVRNWLTDHVDRVLREQGISLYRQDFNMDPLSFWRKQRSPRPARDDREPAHSELPGLLG